MSAQIDSGRLAQFVAEKTGLVALELLPVDVACAWPVYKALPVGGLPFFVKLTAAEPAERTLAFLSRVKDCPFLPRPVLETAPVWEGYCVLCLEWLDATRVDAEAMSDAQAESFLSGCVRLAEILADYDGPLRPLEEGDSPRGKYNALVCYTLRHPLAGRFLRPLLSLPEGERDYGRRRLVPVHGDFQPRNYGFSGDRFAAVFDTDDLTTGLACEDAAYAFTERARKSELSARARARLTDLFLRMVSASPWPREEWLIALNHARLTIAARRLAKRPDSPFIVFDIRRRDRPLRTLVAALKGASC